MQEDFVDMKITTRSIDYPMDVDKMKTFIQCNVPYSQILSISMLNSVKASKILRHFKSGKESAKEYGNERQYKVWYSNGDKGCVRACVLGPGWYNVECWS